MRRLLPLSAMTALCALSLAACAPSQQLLRVPSLEVQQVRLTSLTLPTGFLVGAPSGPPVAHLTLTLRVTNPNPIPLSMANIAATLVIDGSDAGRVNLPNVSLPAGGSREQVAQVAIPVTLGTAAAYLKVARGQQVTYRLDGSFTADFGPMGLQTFGPFTLSQGQWKQAAIVPF